MSCKRAILAGAIALVFTIPGAASDIPVPNNPSIASSMQPLLVPLAQNHAVGMKAEGTTLAAMLQQGQFLRTSVTLQPGKCYTGIAIGTPTAQELVVDLVSNVPSAPAQVLTQSTASPMQTIMADKPNCFRSPLPIPTPVYFRVTMKRGSGPVVAQLYSK